MIWNVREWLECLSLMLKVPVCGRTFHKTLSVHPAELQSGGRWRRWGRGVVSHASPSQTLKRAGNGYLALIRTGEGERRWGGGGVQPQWVAAVVRGRSHMHGRILTFIHWLGPSLFLPWCSFRLRWWHNISWKFLTLRYNRSLCSYINGDGWCFFSSPRIQRQMPSNGFILIS